MSLFLKPGYEHLIKLYMSETKEEVKLKGPLATACKSIQLQIDKNEARKKELINKSGLILQKANDLDVENEGLRDQIKRLKGEPTAAEVLQDISKGLK